MNRPLLLLLYISFSLFSHSQTGYLFVKKGARKKQTYTEGSAIVLRLQDNSAKYGTITRLANDTIYLDGRPVARNSVKEVIVDNKGRRKFHIPLKDLLLVTGGVALVTAGLTLSEQADLNEALLAGVIIGYGPVAIGYLKNKISLKRRRYRIGKKFRLQLIDFYLPSKRGF